MTEAATILRVGLPVRDLVDLWNDRGPRISGATDLTPSKQAGGPYTATWSSEGGKGRLEITGDSESDSLVVLAISADQPEEELKQVIGRLAEALHEVEDVSGASLIEELHPDASADQQTSDDQPL